MESLTVPTGAGRTLTGDETRRMRVEWILRAAAAACFIGHGAFGIITKQAWLPYFAVFGIGESAAYRLMPVVGTIDIASAVIALISPRPFALLYMTVWAMMTALLRPLAGESGFETIERAGNFGVPLALLLLVGVPGSVRSWGDRIADTFQRADNATVRRVLQLTTALLLFGHGALEAVTRKAIFASHYATIGLSGAVAPALGYFEMIVAVAVMIVPTPALLIGIALWKIATEALFPLAGAPIWEFLERAGSYGAPIALAVLGGVPPFTRITFHRTNS
jgi:hypothetical protein